MATTTMRYNIFQDWAANKGYFKGRLVLLCFRLAVWAKSNIVFTLLFCWYLLLYRVFIEWFMGIELSWNLKAGQNLKLFHGQALVVNGNSVIGSNCTLRHSTTIGNKGQSAEDYFNCPKIGNNVDVGSNVCIIGNITIGDNVKIGVGSIVIKDVPSNCVIVGNPARIVKSELPVES